MSSPRRSYGAALQDLGAAERQETGRWLNNRAGDSHLCRTIEMDACLILFSCVPDQPRTLRSAAGGRSPVSRPPAGGERFTHYTIARL